MFELFATGFWPVRHKKLEFRNPFVINVKFTQVWATVAAGLGASIDKFIQGATRLRSIFFFLRHGSSLCGVPKLLLGALKNGFHEKQVFCRQACAMKKKQLTTSGGSFHTSDRVDFESFP